MVNCNISRKFQLLSSVSWCALMLLCVKPQAQIANGIQTKRCPVSTINYQQGLMSNSILGAITDSQGFLWVSTLTGLQRYDGYVLQGVTPVVDGDTLRINYPVFFAAGKENCLLIGFRNGVLEYNAANNSFRKILSVPSAAPAYSLVPVVQTREGIWCFEENVGIIIFDNTGRVFRQFPESRAADVENMLHHEEYNITRKIIAANSRNIFLRTSAHTILQIDLITCETKSIIDPGQEIIGIDCDDHKIYVASTDGLASINIRDGTLSKKYSFSGLNDYPVTRSAIELSSDHHLLVSVEKHLYEFDTACICQKEIVSLSNKPLLTSGYIQIVYEDPFKRICA